MTDIATSAPAVSSVVEGFLEAVRSGTGADTASLFAADGVLDAVVPNWHFQVHGRTAIGEELGRWYADPGEFEAVEVSPTPQGAIVTFTLSWEENGVPHACRQAHLLSLGPDGRIAQDHAWCGGRWSAQLLAEMEAARHAG